LFTHWLVYAASKESMKMCMVCTMTAATASDSN
jgi:uncharacterized membrane protein